MRASDYMSANDLAEVLDEVVNHFWDSEAWCVDRARLALARFRDREDYDSAKSYIMTDAPSDPWGSCMTAFFDVAAEMCERGLDHPEAWCYRPGGGGHSIELQSGTAPVVAGLSDDDLFRLGELMHRWSGMLKVAGRSY